MKRFLPLVPHFFVFLGGISISLLAGASSARAQFGCCYSSRPPAYPIGGPIPVTPTPPAGNALNSYYGSYGTLPPSPGTFLPAGLPQSSAAFLPTAAYDTQWMQTPVTYYRPVTQFDPNYGTTVTSLQPCTSYQYQAARVPLVSPRFISDYQYSANRWPAANTPGYYPTAVAPAAYPSFQQMPAAGMPVTSNRMNYAASGTSTGPSSTLPLATMGSTAGGVAPATYWGPSIPTPTPYPANQATAWMPPSSSPMSQIPITSAIPGTGTPVYTVPSTSPTSSLMPMNALAPCPNGVCVQSNVPSIPGAASVVPMGPPTLMPSTAMPSTVMPSNGTGTAAPTTTTLPFTPGTSVPLPSTGDIKPILPPGSNADPEATRQPSLGNSAAMFPLRRVPVSDLDRVDTFTQPPAQPPAQPAPQPLLPQESRTRLPLPSTAPPSLLQPLKAPNDFDAKPRWNPNLLPPSNEAARETVASTTPLAYDTV